MNEFEKYKALKDQYDLVYKGIHLNRVMALVIWSLANNKNTGFRWTSSIKIFLARNVEKMNFDEKCHTILTSFGEYSRREYLRLYANIISKIGCNLSYNDISELGHKVCFSLSSFVQFIKSFKCLIGTDLTFIQKWKLPVDATYYCNTIDLLEKTGILPQKFLCMSHTLGFDNLLTQYYKLRKIPTYSLQEGIYFFYGDNPPLDSILYENFETDKLLCWGQYTIDEYKKYGIDKKRFIISGYPKELALSNVVIKKTLRKCIVFLARNRYDSSNEKLIELLSKFSTKYEFSLKLHPSCNFEYYNKLAVGYKMSIIPSDKLINDTLNNVDYDFSIAVNTTVYYEALMRGLPCLRYQDESFVLMAGLDDVFTDSEQFGLQMHVLQTVSINEYQKQINEMLEYSIGLGQDNYVEMINK